MTELGYILKQDILNIINSETLQELTGGRRAIGSNDAVDGDDLIWEKYRAQAIEKVKSYSRHWYDMDTEMRTIYEYVDTDDFSENDRVAGDEDDTTGERTIYVAIQDAPAGTELTDTDYYTEGDDRNPVLVELTTILILYNTFRRLNPRQLPEQRNIDYDNAISTLKDIQNGKIELDITERDSDDVDTDDAGQQVAWGEFDDVPDYDY